MGAGIYNVASTDGDGSYTAIKTDTDFEFHGGAGAKIFFTDIVHLRLDARAIGLPSKDSKSYTLDWEFMAGIGFTFGGTEAAPPPPPPPLIKDSDNDGIPDAQDKCPTQAGPKENDGCPDKDLDGDGLVDRKDKCPDKPGPVERDGCPEEDKDRRRHRRRPGQVPRRARGQGQVRGRGRLPGSGQRQGRRPGREGQVPDRARDQERLSGR